MTNKEYIEQNNISFSEALKMWPEEKYPCITSWLRQKRSCKFKVGDFIRRRGDNWVGVVINILDKVYIRKIDRKGNLMVWEGRRDCDNKWYTNDCSVFYIDEYIDECEKI